MNTVIPVLVALIGLILLGMMLAFYLRMVKEYHLKKNRSEDEAVADMLMYAAVVDDGVIVCKNGSFMASFFLKVLTTRVRPIRKESLSHFALIKRLADSATAG
ncbi:hypothetical protein [Klebsiella quasipneumoniae]